MERNTQQDRWTRREVLSSGAGALVAATIGASLVPLGCSPSAPQCFDPDSLSSGELSLRKSQGYVDRSKAANPDGSTRTCAGCQFFQASSADAGCGQCQILGGPVSGGGHCNAWAARKTA